MIFNIPHSSTKMLEGIEVQDLEKNQKLLTDRYTDELFFHKSADPIIFPYSRFSVDVERLLYNEPMEKYGMGICYEKDVFGSKIIRNNDICMDIYNDHHYKINRLVNKYLSYFENVFVVDCHSFSNTNFVWMNHNVLPDICIGTNSFHTPIKLINDLYKYFTEKNFSVMIDIPFSGTFIPDKFINNINVKSIMLEINQKLYLNDDCTKNDHFTEISNIITKGIDIIESYEN